MLAGLKFKTKKELRIFAQNCVQEKEFNLALTGALVELYSTELTELNISSVFENNALDKIKEDLVYDFQDLIESVNAGLSLKQAIAEYLSRVYIEDLVHANSASELSKVNHDDLMRAGADKLLDYVTKYDLTLSLNKDLDVVVARGVDKKSLISEKFSDFYEDLETTLQTQKTLDDSYDEDSVIFEVIEKHFSVK